MGLYSQISRLSLNPLLAMFDYPDPNVHAERRVETTTPLQKLFVLNSPFMVEASTALADRLHADVPGDGEEADRRRIDWAYRLLYGRRPTAVEEQLGLRYLAAGDERDARWPRYGQVLLAANELAFVD